MLISKTMKIFLFHWLIAATLFACVPPKVSPPEPEKPVDMTYSGLINASDSPDAIAALMGKRLKFTAPGFSLEYLAGTGDILTLKPRRELTSVICSNDITTLRLREDVAKHRDITVIGTFSGKVDSYFELKDCILY